jgi:hypothetical protein
MALSDLLINPVTIQKQGAGTSMAGGTGALGTAVTYSASVQEFSGVETANQQRVGEAIDTMIYFDVDPLVKPGDQITCGTKKYRVLAEAEDQAGRGIAFGVKCKRFG